HRHQLEEATEAASLALALSHLARIRGVEGGYSKESRNSSAGSHITRTSQPSRKAGAARAWRGGAAGGVPGDGDSVIACPRNYLLPGSRGVVRKTRTAA